MHMKSEFAFYLWAAASLLGNTMTAHGQLEILDQPMWIFPGQPFRISLRQPAGSGQLQVEVPESLDMFDRWDQDDRQRFYFRASKPGKVAVRFSGRAGEIDIEVHVLAWAEVYQPRTHAGIQLPRIWPLGDADTAEGKTRRTLHTEAQLAELRTSGKAVGRAPRWLEMSDAEVYTIIPGPSVPRTCLMTISTQEGGGIGKGCPVCGDRIFEGRSGFYPWLHDSAARPWKLQCPACQTLFPSNDWQAGDMHSGDFPDDGFGCEPVVPQQSADGKYTWRWPFIAYYHQHVAYMREFTPGIIDCARSFVATGDQRYAHKCAVALFRFAECMLDLAVNLNHRKMANRDGILNWPVGAPRQAYLSRVSGTFMYIQPNWDTPRMENAARAWDLIFDHLDGNTELIEFCQANHHPEIQSIDDFRRFVDAGVLRVPIQACLDNAVARNYPMQETTVATMALGLGTPRTMELVDWLLNASGVRFALSNQFYIDGSGHESPAYNAIAIRGITRLFGLLDRIRELHPDLYVPPRYVSPMRDPKFRRIYDFPLEFSLIGRTYPVVGDSGGAGVPNRLPEHQGYPCTQADWLTAYEVTGDPRFARALYGPDGRDVENIRHAEVRAAAVKHGSEQGWLIQTDSNILDGYGHAILRSGEGDSRRALWLRYARMLQHRHDDMLTYGLAGHCRELLPELGYPKNWGYARHWEANWGTHYGTHIVGVRASSFNKGTLTTFAGAAPVQVAAAESRTAAGDHERLRQRLIALIDLGPDDYYAVTVERVRGGSEQVFSFHGPDGEAMPLNLEPVPYEGTALGEGLEYGDFSAAQKTDPDLSCLAFMRDPARAAPTGIWGLDYALRDQENVHLRMHNLYPEGGEITLAKGTPTIGKKSYDITWAILRSEGQAPLRRQYLNVIEPYVGMPRIDRIQRLAVTGGSADAEFAPLAFRVVSADRTDTFILQYGSGDDVKADGILCDGEFGFWRERAGKLETAALVRGTKLLRNGRGLHLSHAEYRGKIVSCDWPNRTLLIEPAPPSLHGLIGRHIRITNEHGSSCSYHIANAEQEGSGCRITVDIDPRIGEGFVAACRDGVVESSVDLKLHPFGYYAGKTLADETNQVHYKLRAVEKARQCLLVDAEGGRPIPAQRLQAEFGDSDGDGLTRFIIYDHGPGDRVSIVNFAVLQ